jgi:indolepyruvate decarboxylase
MHHTMADGSYDHFLDAYARVTTAHVRLTPRNAAAEIDRLILTAWREKLPVYMELPSDIAYLDIEVPVGPLTLADPPSDTERLRSCIAAIAERFSAAVSPAILVDADASRFGVASDLMELAEKTQAPVAVINAAKSVIDETFSHYLGIYIGKASEPHVREAIETSDCLFSIGYRPLEVTTGDFSASLPANTIHARGYSVDVGDDNYQAVTLKEILRGVIDAVPHATKRAAPHHVVAAAGTHFDDSAKLTQAAYWQAIQNYLRPGDVIFVDNGTSYALFGLKFPPKCTFVGSVNWGSIGYSVGALLGTLTAAPERRHLLFVGTARSRSRHRNCRPFCDMTKSR